MTTTRYSIVPTLTSVVPVTAGLAYIGWVRVAVDIAGRNCYAKFFWYDSNYKFISTSALTNPVSSTGAFAWQIFVTQATAPAGAAYAGVVPEIQDPTGGNVCEWYVDRHKITTSALNMPGPRAWAPPRQITITPQSNVVNEMQNPAFGDATNPLWGWRPSGTKTTNTVNSSVALHDGNSMDVTTTGLLPGDLSGQLCFGAHTLSSTALYQGSDLAKPPITTLEPDTDYTISLWVKPVRGFLPVRLSFNDGFGEYVGTATPYSVYGASPPGWERLSVTMHTNTSNTGSGRISVGFFSSDITALENPVTPAPTGQLTWTPWAGAPRGYRGMWQSTTAYTTGDVVSRGTYFATALSNNTGTDPNTDTLQVTWSRFNLTQATGDPLYVLGVWSATTTYPGESLGLAVEYPAGSGVTYIMAAPSNIFGAAQSTALETCEYLVDEILVSEGVTLYDFFDGDIPSPDYLWEGARYDSRSFYFQNARTAQERLERIIGGYVPFGTPIEIDYSQQAVKNLWSTS
jgi:hypothetical protein